MRRGLLVAVVLALCARPGHAEDLLAQAWKRGNDAYFKGDYAGAVAAYTELDRQGIVSSDVCYNLGVAHFRTGALGRAVWAFERAVALDPDDEDARFNLQQARKVLSRRTHDKIEEAEREATWIRLVTFVSPSMATWVFIALWLSTFTFLLLRRRAPIEGRATWSAAAALAGVASLLAGTLLLGRVALDRLPFGIVLPDALAVKEGADPNYRTSFEVHAGLRVRLLEHDQGWVRVRLANGLEGWVRDADVGPL